MKTLAYLRPLLSLGAVLGLGLAVMAPAPAVGARSVADIANLTGAERQKVLVKGARAEGQLMWYTSLIINQAARPIKAAFEATYPFIQLEFIRANSSKLLQRLLAESRARSYHADVVVASVASVLKKAKLAQPFRSPELAAYEAAYPKDFMDPDRMWATVRFSYNGIGYNTKLVAASGAPKTYEDLLDPKWKGKLVWGKSLSTGAPLFISFLRRVWGEKRAMAYFKKLAKQNIIVGTGSIRSVLDRVIAGEYPVMISAALHHVAISRAKGAPVASASPEPVIGRNGYVMMLKTAPHPHAAMLFVDFMLSERGQNILRKARYLPAHPKVEPLAQMKTIVPKFNGLKEYVIGPEEQEALRKSSQEIFKKLFR